MTYSKIVHGKFIFRPNRFIAHVLIEGKEEIVHVKNTGRCKELLLPDSDVILEDFREAESGKNRKTQFDLIAVYKKNLLINMDSNAPNKVVLEYLKKQDFDFIKPEYKYGNSRIDFYMEKKNGEDTERFLLEIKGCTLEKDGIGYFPDAPTERGVKHLRELTAASRNGFKCGVGFVIQMEGVSEVRPNIETDPEFGIALEEAKNAGVEIIFFLCKVTENALWIEKKSHSFV